MKHFKKPIIYKGQYGSTYELDDPRFRYCTLYEIGDKGLIVIQQYYDKETKHTWWGPVESCMRDAIYIHPNFKKYFDEHATEPDENGRYLVVPIRIIMHALKMLPLEREPWETRF